MADGVGNTGGCMCGRIHVGMTTTEARNWNPDCPEHGVDSAWYRSDEQVAAREAQRALAVSLQCEASRVRRHGGPRQRCSSCGHKHTPLGQGGSDEVPCDVARPGG